MVTLLIVLVAVDTPDNLISLGGLAAFIVLAWVTSINPARVSVRAFSSWGEREGDGGGVEGGGGGEARRLM